jgi:SAM-dependent methyltransferase
VPFEIDLAEDGLRRSVQLFRAFRLEQSRPELFYRTVGLDAVRLVGRHGALAQALVLDIGAGHGWYGDAFRDAGATYVAVDADAVAELADRRPGIAALAEHLPVHDGSVDVAFSSNLLEHVRSPWSMAAEMVRITRPGGLVVLSFTNWLSPWGGHETSPWHYLGGERAASRYERRNGHPPKNRIGASLFKVSVSAARAWARQCPDIEVLEERARYLPTWAAGIVRVPGLSELLAWNLWLVARRR